MTSRLQGNPKILWLQWSVAFAFGYTLAPPLGFFLAALIAPAGGADLAGSLAIMDGTVAGVLIGGLQWFLLRRRVAQASSWFFATVLGLVIGYYLSFLIYNFLNVHGAIAGFVITGLCLGVAQGRFINLPSPHYWYWILVNSIGWAVAGSAGNWAAIHLAKFWFFPVTGAIVGMLTGVVLISTLKGYALGRSAGSQ